MYGGKPVPSGSLRFIPDFDKGNRGTATTIMITDGTYRSVDGWGENGDGSDFRRSQPTELFGHITLSMTVPSIAGTAAAALGSEEGRLGYGHESEPRVD